jgi:tripartite-type tricarboxylate transporter receptor subunit TctC
MALSRRRFLRLAASVAALPVSFRITLAQGYPIRPVRIIVGYPAGGSSDFLARIVGQRLSERFGQTFLIENRSGADSNIATEAVVRARPDGYTLFLSGSTNAINATLYKTLQFNFILDTAPVAGIAIMPHVMTVHPSFPAKTVPEFIAYVKDNPGKINMASAGNGTPNRVAGELFKILTGTNMMIVPYRGGAPAAVDLLGQQVHAMFQAMSESIEYIRAGKLRALAVTSATRSNALADIPTVGDFVPGFEASVWFGVSAPKGTNTEIINKLNKEINEILYDPKVKASLADLGASVLPGSPADYGKLIADETEKWGKVVRDANIKVE